jgi:hypothetical protein
VKQTPREGSREQEQREETEGHHRRAQGEFDQETKAGEVPVMPSPAKPNPKP